MKKLCAATIVLSLLCLLPIVAAGANTGEFPIAANPKHHQVALSAAFDGTNYLVGIEDSANCPGTKCVSAVTTRLVNGTTGALIGSPITVTSEAAIPSIAFDGTNYLVVWKGTKDAGYAIYGQRVSTSGTLTGDRITISPSAAGMGGQHDIIRVLFDGMNYFVVWEDRTDAASQATGKIYGRFVSPSGDLLGAEAIAVSDPAAQYGQVLPAMATDGSNIFVVWIDGRNQKACSPVGGACYPSEIYGQFVTTSITGTAGALSDTNFAIYDSTRGLPRDRLPSIAWSGTNYFLLSQERNVFPDEACPWYGCVWDVSGIFVDQTGAWQPSPKDGIKWTFMFSNSYDNNYPSVTWDGSAFFIAFTKRLSASKIFVDTASYYPDQTWASGFSLTAEAGGATAPWAAVALPQGTGKPFFTLINRGKPGKTWSDIDLYTGGKVYGTIMADLEQISVSDPPAATQVSQKLNITDTVQNVGFGPSLASATVYMFSPTTDPNDPGVWWLTGQRKVPSVAAGGTNTGAVSVTIPTWMPAGAYYLIACADYGTSMPDTDFTNNCKASTGTTVLSKPDLTETSVTNEDLFVPNSSSSSPPHTIAVTDIVTNQGDVKSSGTTTRYYLSPSTTKNDPGAVLLTGTRGVPALGPGASSTSKKTTVKIPLSKSDMYAVYNLLACANDNDKTGKNGPNNCKVSSTPQASISCSACH